MAEMSAASCSSWQRRRAASIRYLGYRAARRLMVHFAGLVTTGAVSFAYYTSSSVLHLTTIRSSCDGPPRLPESLSRIGAIRNWSRFCTNSLNWKRSGLQQHAFELHAWSAGSGPSWLGARHTEAACWSAFAGAISKLSGSLDEPSWWEPLVVIEQGLLSVYCAGRSILRRDQHGGVEAMVRPRIRASIATQAGQAHQMRIWLQQNATHEWSVEARDLIAQIDGFIEQSGSLKRPPEAANERTSLAAIIAGSSIPGEQRNVLLGVVENAMSLQLANMTSAEAHVIERCCNEVRGHADYSANTNGARLFDTVLLWLVRFIFNRLELTKGDDPTGAYLFECDDGSLPHEDELQQDFFRWVATYAAGSDLEPTNIASGRADIRLKSGPERLVVEVKP